VAVCVPATSSPATCAPRDSTVGSGRIAGPSRYDSLDFWRGVACLAVVIYHAVLLHLATPGVPRTGVVSGILAWFGQLSAGVYIFFVISGYCIAAASDRSRITGLPVRDYFVRRFRRIYPPLWFAMGFAIAVFLVVDVLWLPRSLSSEPWIQPRPWWHTWSQWLGNLTLIESWRPHVFGSPRAHFPGQAWTLCYEEQFYAVMGGLLLMPRLLFRGVAVVSVGTIAAVVSAPHFGWDLSGFFFDGSWLNFAAGVLVYHGLHRSPRGARYVGIVLLLVGAAISPQVGVPGGAVGFVFAVVLWCLHPFDRGISSSIVLRPITWCGEMCYSLYLVHQLLVKAVAVSLASIGMVSPLATLFVTVPLSIVVSVAFGRLFYLVVERRFIKARPVYQPAGVAATP
jgi:peptidoglycan/LPS O-acetylase OafA/YrhL